MNTYALTFRDHTENEVAATAGKAKYSFFLGHEIGDSMEFGDFVKSVECKLVHKFHVRDLFTENIKDFERMKSLRGIEFAHLGMKVEVNGKKGVIVGSNRSLNLDVCFEGEHWKSNCHPWYKVRYFDNHGKLIKEFMD
ncbi:Hypothetical protein DPCES_1392 [Desulfitobacterium hafniense]|uniref:Uncharacterized protein n=1 Tax=Desulfitobacterium hafniense TaxID=49338 RepID=A0A098AXB5_DESHA|nr:hypothetical protein [Desulfitobacterium hafniense]CDX01279.1 Hypothetical protein DPCES_1392 [Desulfitobacterium hafniense]